ncbi:hypothetical protein D3C81_1501700 [compost metagenome]
MLPFAVDAVLGVGADGQLVAGLELHAEPRGGGVDAAVGRGRRAALGGLGVQGQAAQGIESRPVQAAEETAAWVLGAARRCRVGRDAGVGCQLAVFLDMAQREVEVQALAQRVQHAHALALAGCVGVVVIAAHRFRI